MSDGIDQEILVHGLEQTQHARDALSWWSGTWVAGERVPFYRPLTSTVWWLMWNASGASRFEPGAIGLFMGVHFLSHFLACMGLGVIAREIAGARAAIAAAVLWAGCLVTIVLLPIPAEALPFWKDSPDIWTSLAIMAALGALVRWRRTGERWALGGVFAAAVAGICIKELTYVLPLLAAGLVASNADLVTRRGVRSNAAPSARASWCVVGALVALVLAAYAFRWWALGGPGFRFGTNGAWPDRALFHLATPGAMLAWRGHPNIVLTALIPIGALLLLHWTRPAKRLAWIIAINWSAGVLGLALALEAGRGESGQLLADLGRPLFHVLPWMGFTAIERVLALCALVFSGVAAFERRDRAALCAACWVFGAYTPLLTAPLTDHALYLCSAGWALWWGIAIVRLGQSFAPRMPRARLGIRWSVESKPG